MLIMDAGIDVPDEMVAIGDRMVEGEIQTAQQALEDVKSLGVMP
jgi:hypothetical protein